MKTHKRKEILAIIKFVLANAIVLFGIALPFICSFNDTEYTITVTDKERIHNYDGKYLVFGEDSNGNSLVFENSDNLLRWKFDSSNFQGRLKEGHTYNITVVGYRIPFLSWYENIISINEVKSTDNT